MHASTHPWPFIFMGQGGPWGRHGRRGHGRHHGPPPWVMHMMGSSGRAERGEVRYLILDALTEGPSHGYGIIGVIERKSSGAYRPSPGSIYPTLQMLEELGHVVVTEEDDKKHYAITDAGKAELDEHIDEVEDAYNRLSSGTDWTETFDFHGMGRRLGRVMRTIGRGVKQGWLGKGELQQIKKTVEGAVSDIEEIIKQNRS